MTRAKKKPRNSFLSFPHFEAFAKKFCHFQTWGFFNATWNWKNNTWRTKNLGFKHIMFWPHSISFLIVCLQKEEIFLSKLCLSNLKRMMFVHKIFKKSLIFQNNCYIQLKNSFKLKILHKVNRNTLEGQRHLQLGRVR